MNSEVLRDVYPLCLGGNVFGWTIGEDESFAVLDAYAAAGGNFIDTADVYSAWIDGNVGGESETIIGRWMKARGNREAIILATKVGELGGVGAGAISEAIDASLRRLQTDHIDLYYTHIDDRSTPLEETLGALHSLVRSGKVRELGASHYTASRLAEAQAIADRDGMTRYTVLQPLYNLLERDEYEGELQDTCQRENVTCVPFFGLARGFLTGKYRPGHEAESKRGALSWTDGWNRRAVAVLGALDETAAAHGTTVAAVALAWLSSQPTVRAPIASARNVAQLQELLPMAELRLDSGDLQRLTDAANSPVDG